MRVHLATTVTIVVAVCSLGCGDEAVIEDDAPEAAVGVSPDEREQLEILGYVNAVPVPEGDEPRSGVTQHDAARSYDGLNLWGPRNESKALLMDPSGAVLHRWASEEKGATWLAFQDRFPEAMPTFLNGWNHVELLEDGGVLAIGSHHVLLRLDRNSKILWKLDLPVHHDVSIAPDGDVYALMDATRTAEIDEETVAFQDNLVQVISSSGEPLRTYSLFDAMAAPRWKPLIEQSLRRVARVTRSSRAVDGARTETGNEKQSELARLHVDAVAGDLERDADIKNVLFHNRVQDIFHANSVQVLHRDEPGLWRAGDLLLSILRLDRIAVLDQDSGEMIWSWGSEWLQEAHHATQCDNGQILVFDNGTRRGHSRILRLSPATGNVVWHYQAEPPGSFFSRRRGGVQALPGGNVLISNTDSGQAFEVTPGGDVVWEYFSGFVEDRDGERKRAAIYRMERIPRSAVVDWLPSAEQAGEAR